MSAATDDYTSAMARLYGPTAEEYRRALPDHGESVHAQLCVLAARPSLDRCDTAIRNLAGLVTVLHRYRERLLQEGEHA